MTTPFHSLDDYLALPRLTSLAISPDGHRLVVGQQALNHEQTAYVTSLWQVDPSGDAPARRLTRGAKGEGGAAFTATGDLLFVARRAEPGISEDDATACLWRLPAGGGEAHVLTRRPDGVSSVLASRAAATVLVLADTLPSATDEARERALRKVRKDAKVAAILHSSYPVRYWDSDLGPAAPRLFVVEGDPLPPEDDTATTPEVSPDGAMSVSGPGQGCLPTGPEVSPDGAMSVSPEQEERGTRDLTPDAGRALDEVAVSADGTFAVGTWRVPEARGVSRTTLVRIDVATGERRTLVDTGVGGADLAGPAISPDGRLVAYVVETRSTPTTAPRTTAWVVASDGTHARELVPDWDRWPGHLEWLPDSAALLAVADDEGNAPVFRIPVHDGATAADVVRLTRDGAYSSVVVAPDGASAFALRSSYLTPAEVVRIDLVTDASEAAPSDTAEARHAVVTVLRGPSEPPELPGVLTDVETTVTDPDGTTVRVRGYLALPDDASGDTPAPLLLWIHGGPLGSWNAWSWRWNPWLLVAQGYAVLLPDPALSTGYGQAFVQRGWGAWGAAPFTDLMALTDEVERRPDIDESRTAAMGGSFGGYMANWVAGHTDRFRAIVTHASLWALDQFGPTTDVAFYWANEVTPEMAEANSPHRFVADIVTPMLVIHGDKDYRVPIGEGLRLWYELLSASGLAAGPDGVTPHRFLYFPDENHWVLSPQHAKVWYEVVAAFLAEHVLGEERDLPEALG